MVPALMNVVAPRIWPCTGPPSDIELKPNPSGRNWPVLSSVAAPGDPTSASVPLFMKVLGPLPRSDTATRSVLPHTIAIGVYEASEIKKLIIGDVVGAGKLDKSGDAAIVDDGGISEYGKTRQRIDSSVIGQRAAASERDAGARAEAAMHGVAVCHDCPTTAVEGDAYAPVTCSRDPGGVGHADGAAGRDRRNARGAGSLDGDRSLVVDRDRSGGRARRTVAVRRNPVAEAAGGGDGIAVGDPAGAVPVVVVTARMPLLDAPWVLMGPLLVMLIAPPAVFTLVVDALMPLLVVPPVVMAPEFVSVTFPIRAVARMLPQGSFRCVGFYSYPLAILPAETIWPLFPPSNRLIDMHKRWTGRGEWNNNGQDLPREHPPPPLHIFHGLYGGFRHPLNERTIL